MPVQPDPPITLDPSQDTGHQLAFINQNFQSIANVLQANSFKIVKHDNVTFTPPNTALTVAAGDNTTVISHNLGYVPIAIIHSTIPEPISGFTGYTNLPFLDFFATGSPNVGRVFRNIYWDVTSTNLTIHAFQSFGITYSATPTYNIKYYLLQETAN